MSEKKGRKKQLSQEDIMNILNKIYETAVNGIENVDLKKVKIPMDTVFKPVETLADDYVNKHGTIDKAAKSFINYQTAKCTTAGFISGLGGIITLPVAMPANFGSVMFVQIQMIVTLAHMGGFDVRSDQVKTMVYMCLAGLSVDQLLKQSGIQFGNKLAVNVIKKIPGEVLTKINQRLGFRFITKFGEKGVINLGKTVPFVGGVISGGMDAFETKQIAKRAYKLFIEKEIDDTSSAERDFFDVEYIEI